MFVCVINVRQEPAEVRRVIPGLDFFDVVRLVCIPSLASIVCIVGTLTVATMQTIGT